MEEVKVFFKLLPYQRPHVQSLLESLRTYDRAADLSDTGTGKTYSSISLCLLLNLKPIIICPKAVIPSWIKVLKFFNCRCYGIANYELFVNCRWYPEGNIKQKESCDFLNRFELDPESKDYDENIAFQGGEGEKKKHFTYHWDLPEDAFLIFDEAHRCKNIKTAASGLLRSVSFYQVKILLLSATICDKPKLFKAAGLPLGLYPTLRKGVSWIRQAGQGFVNPMEGVQKIIFPQHASRMRISSDQIKDLFPDNDVKALCYDMDCAPEIQRVYDQIKEEIEEYQRLHDNAHIPLAKIMRLRQKIELLKAPSLVKIAQQYLEEKKTVLLFVNFEATLQFLAEELETDCLIHGSQSTEERQSNIDAFNNGLSSIIICNIKSGGTGLSLHDTRGDLPRVSIISPSWSAQNLLQCLGRPHRAEGKSAVIQRIVYCKETIEEEICKNIREKIENIAFLNDGKTLDYNIEGLITGKEKETTEKTVQEQAQENFQRLETLQLKKERLEQELQTLNDQITQIQTQIQGFYF